jgi:hypothetical protein
MCCDRNNDNFAFVILQLTLKNQGSCKIRKAKKAVLKSTGTVTSVPLNEMADLLDCVFVQYWYRASVQKLS